MESYSLTYKQMHWLETIISLEDAGYYEPRWPITVSIVLRHGRYSDYHKEALNQERTHYIEWLKRTP
jgi:hypothetical protein